MRKYIPNSITCCNLICGCIAVGYGFYARGQQELVMWSFAFIMMGALFDFFDGFSARLLGVSSAIGKELDSLADVITFGFAPATLVYSMLTGLIPGNYTKLAAFAFLIAAFSALRLAKFNTDTRQTMGFIGLPTPANALFWGSVTWTFVQHKHYALTHPELSLGFIAAGIIFSCWIMVSEVPMFALKFHDFSWKHNKQRYSFILTSAVLLAVFQLTAFAVIIPLYVVSSLALSRCSKKG